MAAHRSVWESVRLHQGQVPCSGKVLCSTTALTPSTCAARSDPSAGSANVETYPQLACQANVILIGAHPNRAKLHSREFSLMFLRRMTTR